MRNKSLMSDSSSGSYLVYGFSLVSANKTVLSDLNKKNKEIEDLAKLPAGWDFGAGDLITESVIARAKQVHSIANLLQLKTEVLPQTSGGITLNFYKSSDSEEFLEVTINADLSIDYVWEEGKGIEYKILDEKEKVTLTNLQSKLSSLSSPQWNSSEPSTLENIRLSSVGSVVIVSPITTAGYPFSRRSVQSEKADQYASI